MSDNYFFVFPHIRYNNKTYRVDDIDWDGRPSHTFEKRGEKITYKDYFKQVIYGLISITVIFEIEVC